MQERQRKLWQISATGPNRTGGEAELRLDQLSVLHSRVAESPSLTHTRVGGVLLCHHPVVMSSSLSSGKEKSRITIIPLKLLQTSRTRTIDYYLPLKDISGF